MLAAIGVSQFKDLLKGVPVFQGDLKIPSGLSEGEVLRHAHELAFKQLLKAHQWIARMRWSVVVRLCHLQ